MVTEHEKKHEKNTEETEPNLKGTLISVSVVGAILVISWFGVFFLYLVR